MTAFGVWAIPTAVVLIIGYGLMRGVRVFEVFLEGAKEGLEMSWRILPALVALVVAVGMFKASGGLDLLSFALSPLGRFFGAAVRGHAAGADAPCVGQRRDGRFYRSAQDIWSGQHDRADRQRYDGRHGNNLLHRRVILWRGPCPRYAPYNPRGAYR